MTFIGALNNISMVGVLGTWHVVYDISTLGWDIIPGANLRSLTNLCVRAMKLPFACLDGQAKAPHLHMEGSECA